MAWQQRFTADLYFAYLINYGPELLTIFFWGTRIPLSPPRFSCIPVSFRSSEHVAVGSVVFAVKVHIKSWCARLRGNLMKTQFIACQKQTHCQIMSVLENWNNLVKYVNMVAPIKRFRTILEQTKEHMSNKTLSIVGHICPLVPLPLRLVSSEDNNTPRNA